MRWHHFLLLALAVVALAAAVGGYALPRVPLAVPPIPVEAVDPPGAAPPPEPTDPAAVNAIDWAVYAVVNEHVHWLETGIRQVVRLPGLSYETQGRYLLAPGRRFRLELESLPGLKPGVLLMVSDGTSLWQANRIGNGGWSAITRLRLRDVFATLDGPAGSPRLRSEFLQGPSFCGVGPLLRNLRTQLSWVRREIVSGQFRLTGVWPADTREALAPADQPWPAGLPRQCRLCLDGKTLWPDRVEWWGPAVAGGDDTPLACIEFRGPRINRPLSPERCAVEFSFDPGDSPVTDETRTVTSHLAQRARQLAEGIAP